MTRTLYLSVDPNEFTRVLTTQEISELCVQISSHILNLFAFYYKAKPLKLELIRKHKVSIQFRLGILGRSAMESIEPSTIKPNFINIVTKSLYEFEEDTVTVVNHDMSSTNMRHVCPDTLLDFLLVFLEATLKSLEHRLVRLPIAPRIVDLFKENYDVLRSIVSDLRPLAKIPSLPSRPLDTGIASLSINFNVKSSKIT